MKNSKNENLEEIIKRKLGDEYTIIHKPVTMCQGAKKIKFWLRWFLP